MRHKDLSLAEVLFKTINHFTPDFFTALKKVPDPRNPLKSIYPIEEQLLLGILLFLLKLGARRNLKFELNSPLWIQNLQQLGRFFFSSNHFPNTLPHGDTLNYILSRIPNTHIESLRTRIIRSLLRKKCLERFRLLDHYYPVAIDATGCLRFNHRHCNHCLVKNQRDSDTTVFYHPVLEAKLVLHNGMALSIATEFIENQDKNVSKQDCELKAFYRLSHKIKSYFPQLKICLLLDSLFAGKPVFDSCIQNHWAYLITLKEGSMRSVYREFCSLKKISADQTLQVSRKKLNQFYHWINDIDYQDLSLNVLECRENSKRFVFLSSLKLDRKNVVTLSSFGRLRWKIENEGFNTQKNGGYGLEHAFSHNLTAMKNFYLLMQIAHIFNQLIEKGSLLLKRIKRSWGSLKVLSRKLLANLTESLIDFSSLRLLLSLRIQIRFDTG